MQFNYATLKRLLLLVCGVLFMGAIATFILTNILIPPPIEGLPGTHPMSAFEFTCYAYAMCCFLCWALGGLLGIYIVIEMLRRQLAVGKGLRMLWPAFLLSCASYFFYCVMFFQFQD